MHPTGIRMIHMSDVFLYVLLVNTHPLPTPSAAHNFPFMFTNIKDDMGVHAA